MAVVRRPGPDGISVLLLGRGDRSLRGGSAGGSPAGIDVVGEHLTELVGIRRGQVDLVTLAIEGKRDGLGRRAAVEIIGQFDVHLLGHGFSFFVGEQPQL